jgi:preprotein translocase subunit SecE
MLLFLAVNKPRMADFMIATEGEMKKVSWSSKREVIGSTKVVIFTTFALALILFAVDIIFKNFFQTINVLRIPEGG